MDTERLTSETALRGRRCSPDFLQSVKLGYGFSFKRAIVLTFHVILFLLVSVNITRLIFGHVTTRTFHFHGVNTATAAAGSLLLIFLLALRWSSRSRAVYLVEFSCYKPEDERKLSIDGFMKVSEDSCAFNDDALGLQSKVLKRAGIGDEAYIPKGITSRPPELTVDEALSEAEAVMFGSLDALFEKTGLKPTEIGILIVNCSLFSPTPSLSDMIVNHYNLRSDIKSYNLSGMGCSAGIIAIAMAKDLLNANPNTYAVVVSTENITLNWYLGNDRSMLVSNCLFRMGGAAVLLSNNRRDRRRSKYELVHTVRTHKGADDKSFRCVYQKEDDAGKVGVSLARELLAIAGDALKTNITTLGPLVLPLSEQATFFVSLMRKKVLKAKVNVKPYIPNFKLAFEHVCIHAGGRAVLDELQKNLRLTEWHMEPSRMTLYRFGNTSSSSLWYELAYTEAKCRVAKGNRIWQIAFGSGFKCNSAVWRALRAIPASECERVNPWFDSIGEYPVRVPA